MKTPMLVLASSVFVAGCATQDKLPDGLAGACQLRPCICADPNTPWWHQTITVPIQWKEDGSAYCPPGYNLQRADKKKK